MTHSQSPALVVIHCLTTILGEQNLKPTKRQAIIEHIGTIESAILEDKVPAHYHFDALLKAVSFNPACQQQVRRLAAHYAYHSILV